MRLPTAGHLARRQFRVCTVLIGVAVVLAGTVLRSECARGETTDAPIAARTTVIFVARRDWHIDIGFAAVDLGAPLDALVGQLPGVRYVFFGFGDRHYLMAKHQNVPAMLGALWPGPGLMLITGLVANPSQAFGADQVIELRLSAAQAQRVQAFIARTLGRGESPVGGDPPANSTGVAPYATGPYEGSLYFTAVPRYSAFHTCNTWAAEALQAGGLPVRSAAVLFAGQLWGQVRRAADPVGNPVPAH